MFPNLCFGQGTTTLAIGIQKFMFKDLTLTLTQSQISFIRTIFFLVGGEDPFQWIEEHDVLSKSFFLLWNFPPEQQLWLWQNLELTSKSSDSMEILWVACRQHCGCCCERDEWRCWGWWWWEWEEDLLCNGISRPSWLITVWRFSRLAWKGMRNAWCKIRVFSFSLIEWKWPTLLTALDSVMSIMPPCPASPFWIGLVWWRSSSLSWSAGFGFGSGSLKLKAMGPAI